jgi:hypothetical protein
MWGVQRAGVRGVYDAGAVAHSFVTSSVMPTTSTPNGVAHKLLSHALHEKHGLRMMAHRLEVYAHR